MLLQTAVAEAATVTGPAVVPVTSKCWLFQNQQRYPWHCPRRVSDSVGWRYFNVLHFAASQSPWGSVLRLGVTVNRCLRRLRDP